MYSDLVDTLIGVLLPLMVAGATWMIRHEIQQWTVRQTARMDNVDVQITAIRADAVDVRTKAAVTSESVARIEGYLAAQNGSGTRLPAVKS